MYRSLQQKKYTTLFRMLYRFFLPVAFERIINTSALVKLKTKIELMACEKKSRIEDGRRQEKTKRVVCVG